MAVRYLWGAHPIVAIVLALDILARAGDCVYRYWIAEQKKRAVTEGLPPEEAVRLLKGFADKCGYTIEKKRE